MVAVVVVTTRANFTTRVVCATAAARPLVAPCITASDLSTFRLHDIYGAFAASSSRRIIIAPITRNTRFVGREVSRHRSIIGTTRPGSGRRLFGLCGRRDRQNFSSRNEFQMRKRFFIGLYFRIDISTKTVSVFRFEVLLIISSLRF